jgi:hypothetical protein
MSRTSGVARHWPALVVALIVLALFVGAIALGTKGRFGTAVVFTATAVPTAIAVGQYLYAHVDRWRLFVNRSRLRLTNPEASLAYTVDYTVESLIAAHAAISGFLDAANDGKQTRRLSKTADGEVWLWQGATLQIHYTEFTDPVDGSSNIVRLQVPSIRASYRGIDKAIREDVGGLLAHLEREVQASRRKYVVTLGFPDENPYFGLLVNRVNRDMVHRFDIDIFETTSTRTGTDRVRIHKDSLEVVSSTAHDTQLLALRYVSCQPVQGV